MPAPAIPPTDGQLLEIFSSIQGEGLLVGCRQVFLRLARCNLDCAYCDTPCDPRDNCRVEDSPGSGNFRSIPNPVATDTLVGILHRWCDAAPGIHHSLSVTGGEPLVQAAVLAEWLPVLRRLLPVCLETNGTLPEALESVLTWVDYIAMDVKLASVSGRPTPWEEHRRFLELARQKSCFVKAVVGEETPGEEVARAARLLAETAPECDLVLQPLTSGGRVAMTPRRLLDLQAAAGAVHSKIRIIPQTHSFLGLL